MNRLFLSSIGCGIVIAMLSPACLVAGQHRHPVTVVHPRAVARQPVVHTRLLVHARYPIHRVLPATVLVWPARRNIVVREPLVFLPALSWTATVALIPTGEHLVWEDRATIERDDDWVDTNFGIDSSGNSLLLDLNGRAVLNFAEVTFANGEVQVVDLNESTHGTGVYKLLDFAEGRRVMTVRLLAKSESDETKLSVYLSK